jgi:hypothetical protein
MRRFLAIVGLAVAGLGPVPAAAQQAAVSGELDVLKQELRRLQERIQRLEQAPPASSASPASAPPAADAPRPAGAPSPASAPSPAAVIPVAQVTTPTTAPRPGETEIQLGEREHIFQTMGVGKPELGGFRFFGYTSFSYSYNSGLQIVPEAFGGTPALADPGRGAFTFNKFSLGVARTFAPWLSFSAAMEVENHADRHSHIATGPAFGCPTGQMCERYGAEAAETEVNLDKLDLSIVAPLGNGLRLSLGRFDVPFGIERHDDNMLLTATPSEVFRFGRPQKMTGFQASYAFAPWLDVAAWLVNRWEAEDSGEGSFNDNNGSKSLGGRIGFTPLQGDQLLNVGIGGWYGAERSSSHNKRWVIDLDVTWTPIRDLLLAGEFVYGGEEHLATLRRVGLPVAEALETEKDVNWFGFYLLAHYDVVKWLGLTFRYGYFDDTDRGRMGVSQTLQSITFAPVVHLSALIPDLRPLGATYPRSRHPFHWVDLKLEYRYNWSDRQAFGESTPNHSLHDRASDSSHQFQLQAIVNF